MIHWQKLPLIIGQFGDEQTLQARLDVGNFKMSLFFVVKILIPNLYFQDNHTTCKTCVVILLFDTLVRIISFHCSCGRIEVSDRRVLDKRILAGLNPAYDGNTLVSSRKFGPLSSLRSKDFVDEQR